MNPWDRPVPLTSCRSTDLPKSRIPQAWPQLLDLEHVCAYLGISASTFRKTCPVPPVALSAAVTRWNRSQIDEWVNSLPPRMVLKSTAPVVPTSPYDVATEFSEQRRQASLKKIRDRNDARRER